MRTRHTFKPEAGRLGRKDGLWRPGGMTKHQNNEQRGRSGARNRGERGLTAHSWDKCINTDVERGGGVIGQH